MAEVNQSSRENLGRPHKSRAGSRGPNVPAGAGVGQGTEARAQQEQLYAQAMKLYQQGEFARAIEIFEQAAQGPSPEIAHLARVHKLASQRRLSQAKPKLQTPEEHYDYGIALLNERRLEEAEQHLLKALASLPQADYVHYALAICYGFKGAFDKAAEHLRKAVELRPENRVKARYDPDFEAFLRQPQLREILGP